jgi:hypothetical protein
MHLGLLGVKGRNIAEVISKANNKRMTPASMIFILIQIYNDPIPRKYKSNRIKEIYLE